MSLVYASINRAAIESRRLIINLITPDRINQEETLRGEWADALLRQIV